MLGNRMSGSIGSGGNSPKTLWSWGDNPAGNLGTNSTTDRSSPGQVGAGVEWIQITGHAGSGTAATSLAIKSNGTLWSWGDNAIGVLGLNQAITLDVSSPTQVGQSTDWLFVTATDVNAGAIKTNGTLWSWGQGSSGRNGDNSVVSRSSPVQIGTDTNWATTVRADNGQFAIRSDGTLWVWGSATYGQHGLNDAVARSSPAQVGQDRTWRSLMNSATRAAAAATKTDGTLWTWGRNHYGQLGRNNALNSSSPAQVGTHTDWTTAISLRDSFFGIRSNGTLWVWGLNSTGELGLNDRVNRSSPVQVGTLTDWSWAGCGSGSAFAIKKNGTLWSWGVSTYGESGRSSTASTSSPVQVGIDMNWHSVFPSRSAALALRYP